MSTQYALDGTVADLSKMIRKQPDAVRSYVFNGQTTANVIDQIALLTSYNKTDFIEDAVKLAALIIKIGGEEMLRAMVQFDNQDIAEIVNMISGSKSRYEIIIKNIEKKSMDLKSSNCGTTKQEVSQ